MIVQYNIENEEGILIQGKGNYCLKLKKGKLKLKSCWKLLGISDEQEPSVQSAEQVWSSGNMHLPKHEKWPPQHLYLKINSEFHARKNPKQRYLKAVTFSEPSFSKKCIDVYDHAA